MTLAVAFEVGETPEILHTEPLLCSALMCGRSVLPTATWHCPACKERMLFGHREADCPHCGEVCFWTRRAYRWRSHCDCQDTPEQQARKRHGENARRVAELNEFAEAQRRRELDLGRTATADLIEKAAHCWEFEKKRRCNVSKLNLSQAPREFCRACPKFIEEPAASNGKKQQKEHYHG
jgi:hypothetical protein